MTDPYDLAHEAALVGTSRARTTDLEQVADRLLDPAADRSPEARLLELAAAVTRVHRATTRPVPAVDRPAPEAAPPSRREIGPVSSTALQQILLTEHPEVRLEGLDRIAEMGLTLDADSTVRALELATAQPALREAVADAAGPRGAWLAAHNDAWSWLSTPPPLEEAEQTWDHATLAERTALLRAVRRSDPPRGLALLARSADTDRADALAALLPELAEGLSRADEPFLEQRLDDRRVQVRRAAAALLEQLDGSALVERAVARAERRLRLTGRLRKALEVDPPTGLDDEMARDAVSTERLEQAGEQAGLLAHDLARVPPYRLRALLGVDSDRLVALARASDWWPSLRFALSRSGQRWEDVDVLVALVPHVPPQDVVQGLRDDEATAQVLAPALRRSAGRRTVDRYSELFWAVPGPWGAATSRVLWPALIAELDAAGPVRPAPGLQELARVAGRRLLLTAQPLPVDLDRWTYEPARRAAETVLTTYAHRQRLHAALLDDVRTATEESP